MHLGNLYAALVSWLSARRQGGEWLLRIEDIDAQRCRQQWVDYVMEDLQWAGLQWDGEPLRQSLRTAYYAEALGRLEASGLTYPCYCSRADLLASSAPHERDGRVVYAGTCRPPRLALPPAGRQPATRLLVASETVTFTDVHYGSQTVRLDTQCGDFIVRRADGAWAYQLAVVVDDALSGITEVARGRDLLLSSPQQIYLYRLLGYKPPRFAHFPLLINAAGQRLSKRDASLDLGALRVAGYTPHTLIGRLAYAAGLTPSPDPLSAADLIPLFCWDKLPANDILFTL